MSKERVGRSITACDLVSFFTNNFFEGFTVAGLESEKFFNEKKMK